MTKSTGSGPQLMHSGSMRRCTAAALLLVSSAALMILSANVPAFAEWYSRAGYPLAVNSIGRISGLFPFSVSEIGIYILLLAFFVTLVRMVVRLAGSRTGRETVATKPGIAGQTAGKKTGRSSASIFVSWFSGVLLAAGILAFLYTACCGINYHRRSFSEEEGIVTYRYTAQDLKEVCLWLTEEVNTISGEVDRDSSGVMTLEAPEGEGAVEAVHGLAEEFPALEGYYPQPKKLLLSEFLSYQGLTGIYSPFTVEANYNGDMTAYNIPFTTCHELSHLRGFMQEEKANFIAFLACIQSDRTDFRYSGYLSGWVYCMNALYRTDHESWQEVRLLLAEEAEADLEANSAFWDAYEGRISEAADKINDTYLKANGQADGVQSYSRMVDLIVAYFG